MRYTGNIFRPPSEARSLLVQATIGCSHNRCTFCAMYRDKRYRVRRLRHVLEDIRAARERLGPDLTRVFICDGDALVLPNRYLVPVLDELASAFPGLQRVGIYANARDILKRTDAELQKLVKRRLSIFYIGLETGSDRLLLSVDKGATATEMVTAVQRAMAAGMKSSVIYLLGLGGRRFWKESAAETARAVSAMNPNYLSALTVTVVPGTPLAQAVRAGEYEPPSPAELALELRHFLERVDARATVFRANHASNYVPLSGRLPRDRERLVAELDAAIAGSRYRPEFLRGL